MNNITLIGMPGVGKSTIGVVLAKVLGYQFLDSDLLIQKQERRRLREIIEEEGYMGFKEIENRVNASIDVNHTVIATGGSVVYCEEAMNHLRSIGTVVYLKLSLDSLAKRLGKTTKSVTISKNTIGSTTLKGLTSGKYYYVRVRSYKVANGKNIYAPSWSQSVRIKVK